MTFPTSKSYQQVGTSVEEKDWTRSHVEANDPVGQSPTHKKHVLIRPVQLIKSLFQEANGGRCLP